MSVKRLFAALVLIAGFAAPAAAAEKFEPHPLDQVLGKADAPVTIVEYSSLTCPHCATFHKETLPRLKKEWIDTGKARLVYRDFPLDPLAMGGAMLSHCSGPSRYFGFLETLFQTQDRWARAADPVAALRTTAKLGGVSEEQFSKCLSDQKLMNDIRGRQTAGQTKYGIESTPTFVIGDKVIAGAKPFEEFDAALKAAAK